MNQPIVLVVEDDPAIRRGVVDSLQFAGFRTLEAATGAEGLALALGSDCDLLLLDLVLPDSDGIEILRRVRSERAGLPAIVVTARGAERERVLGLNAGADDYVVKPFGVAELLARVQAVLRRAPAMRPLENVIEFRSCTAELAKGRVCYNDGSTKPLTDRELRLLRYLHANRGRVIDRDELLVNVWCIDPRNLETRSVDMQIARLREKLRDDSDPPETIVTVRGKGYQWMPGDRE